MPRRRGARAYRQWVSKIVGAARTRARGHSFFSIVLPASDLTPRLHDRGARGGAALARTPAPATPVPMTLAAAGAAGAICHGAKRQAGDRYAAAWASILAPPHRLARPPAQSPIAGGPYPERMAPTPTPAPERAGAGIPGSDLPGPYARRRVRRRAAREAARVRARAARRRARQPAPVDRARVYFELRDADGAIPCAMWRSDWESILARAVGSGGLAAPARRWHDGMQVIVAGGCDYYAGSATASPAFTLLGLGAARGRRGRPARADRTPPPGARPPTACSIASALLHRPLLPRTIGVVSRRDAARPATTCSPGWPAAAGPAGSSGAFASVQDRHAAPQIGARAARDSPPWARSRWRSSPAAAAR